MKFRNFFLTLLLFLTFLWYKAGIVEAIIGGKEVSEGFHYTVSIQADSTYICSGSIIGDWYIITAAHCVIGEDNNFKNKIYSVIAGVTKIQDNNVQHIDVEIIYVPENYRHSEYRLDRTRLSEFYYGPSEDIAILKLESSLNLSESAKLNLWQLPKRNAPGGHFTGYYNQVAIVKGFGDSSISEKSNSILKVAEVTIMHQRRCHSIFLDSLINDKHFCATVNIADRNSPEGTCQGDDGSPLIYEEKTLIGVLIKPRKDCDERLGPAIYVKVSAFVSFIKDVIGGKKLKNMRVATYRKIPTEVGTSMLAKNLIEVTQFLNSKTKN